MYVVFRTEMEKTKTRTRSSNFTYEEIDVLIDLVAIYCVTIECKKTDNISNSNKEKAWNKVREQFNAKCGSGRSSKMLRGKWDCMKKTARKENFKVNDVTDDSTPVRSMNPLLKRVMNVILLANNSRENESDSDQMGYRKIEDLLLNCDDELSNSNSAAWQIQLQSDLKLDENPLASTSAPESNDAIEETDEEFIDTCDEDLIPIPPTPPLPPPKARDKCTQINTRLKRKRTNSGSSSGENSTINSKKKQLLDLQMKLLKEEHENKVMEHKIKMLILEEEYTFAKSKNS